VSAVNPTDQPCPRCAVHWNESHCPKCDDCQAPAFWSVQNLEGLEMQPITRWFACGRHIHAILSSGQWEVDTVQVMHIEHPMQEIRS
jgi:hypothetical protein